MNKVYLLVVHDLYIYYSYTSQDYLLQVFIHSSFYMYKQSRVGHLEEYSRGVDNCTQLLEILITLDYYTSTDGKAAF